MKKLTLREITALVGNRRLAGARKAHRRNLRRQDNREAIARFARAERRDAHRNREAE